MANGTIAFDTLQTSGQITGTAKSLDTDYVVNGSAKSWAGSLGDGVPLNSFGFSSFVDNGTGDNTCNFTNAMTNIGYSATTSCEDEASPANRLATPYGKTTSLFKIESFIADSAGNSSANQNAVVHGDLA